MISISVKMILHHFVAADFIECQYFNKQQDKRFNKQKIFKK